MEPNVEIVFKTGTKGTPSLMNETFAEFVALSDIRPFDTELLCRFSPCQQESAEAVGIVPEGVTEGPRAPAIEVLNQNGMFLAGDGQFSVYCYSGKLWASASSELQTLPAIAVHTSVSGNCCATNSWKRLSYDLTSDTPVIVGNIECTLKEHLDAGCINKVFGFEDVECTRTAGGSGLFWEPTEADKSLVNAILDTGIATSTFVMSCQARDGGDPELVPTAVRFSVGACSVPEGVEVFPLNAECAVKSECAVESDKPSQPRRRTIRMRISRTGAPSRPAAAEESTPRRGKRARSPAANVPETGEEEEEKHVACGRQPPKRGRGERARRPAADAPATGEEAEEDAAEEKVKKPKTAFFLFMEKNRKEIAAAVPGEKVSRVSQEGGARWKNMTREQKAPYVEEYNRNKLAYEAAMSAAAGPVVA